LGDLVGVGGLAVGHDDDGVVDGVAAGPFAAAENGAGVHGRGRVAAIYVGGDGAASGVGDFDGGAGRRSGACGSGGTRSGL
jgi:hypothetical protein